MVTARRKEKEKEQRRSEIIDAAEKLFFEMGYEGVSMDDVAKETELAKGTLYLYFKNKEELFAKAGTGAEKLLSTGESYYGFYKRYPAYFRLLNYAQSPCFTGESESSAEASRLGGEIVELMYRCILLGQADGSIRKDIDPLKTAWYLIFSLQSAIDNSARFKAVMEAQGVSQDAFVAYALGLMGDSVIARSGRKGK